MIKHGNEDLFLTHSYICNVVKMEEDHKGVNW